MIDFVVVVSMWVVCGIRNVINLLTSCRHGREKYDGSCQGARTSITSECDESYGLTEVIMCTILGPNCFSTQFRRKIIVCQTQDTRLLE